MQKGIEDLDQEFNLFMHSQVPEVEPEDDKRFDGKEFNRFYLDEVGLMPQFQTIYSLFEETKPKPNIKYESLITSKLIGQDILTIRTLTGKRRDAAMKSLYDATELMMKEASADCFYIPGNTASSKNSKEIGFYLKKNPATGKNERVNILTDSKVTKAYKKATAASWLQNKVEFLNQTRHLPLPLMIEFTFIRDSLRGYDFINAAQVIMDLMGTKHGYGWIVDDEAVQICPVFNPITYYHNKLAGVLIKVIR